MNEYVTRPMTAEEVALAVDWAAAEGWNPGAEDAACFRAVDPEGFVGGFLDGRMIASISVVNYGPAFAFLGFYIVLPEFRGQGFGHALWKAAIRRAGDRLVGLDGVPAEQDNYRKSGFDLAYRNIRFGGVPDAATLESWPIGSLAIVPLQTSPDFIALDAALFPAPRDEFWNRWLTAPGHLALGARKDGDLVGAGVIRPCRAGFKIGPLYADDSDVAAALLATLIHRADAKGAELFLDAPEPNSDAVALAEALGLASTFETARMYTGSAPDVELSRLFGVSTFELG